MLDQEIDRLILRSRRDPVSFASLIGLFQARVYSFLARMTGPSAAGLLFQKTWRQVYKASGRYVPGGRAAGWIFKIVHQTARGEYREFSPEPNRPSQSLEDAAALRIAVASLPVEERSVFLLREYGGMPFNEIAETLDLPLETVLTGMNAALDRLRGPLEAYRA